MNENATARARLTSKTAASPHKKTPKSKTAAGDGPVALLSGGNPQIPKGHGDEPVRTYIAAMPGWKQDIGRRLDEIIIGTIPQVRKAVKWNTPFYGLDGRHWFLGFHCLTRYVKVSFMQGASLVPMPPGASKQKHVRYLDIYENDEIDEVQFSDWVKQASLLPGEKL
jgi:hypothetical protein